MKKVIILATVLLLSQLSFAQLKSKVFKVNGIEVYIIAEPVREYNVVDTGGKGVQWGSFITGGLINESISTKVTKYIRKLIKSYDGGEIDFDAIIYSGGKSMTSIKFTDQKTDENDRIAVVQKIKGIPFFVMSEPLDDYEVVKELGGGIKWKSALTAGLVNNSIEQDLTKFAKKNKVKKLLKKKKMNAILYDRGKRANAILID